MFHYRIFYEWDCDWMKEIIDKLRSLKARRIFIQYPEGLKLRIQEISRRLEKEGFEILICCEPTFGACDVRDVEAERLGCEAILHIGHSDFGVGSEIPVIYWEYEIDADSIPVLEKEFHKLKPYRKIGLVTSVQFVSAMRKVKEYLENTGKEVYVHKALKYPGQVLGCCTYATEAIQDKVDCFLYVGAGKFYTLGVGLSTTKPVLCLDLEKKEIYDQEELKKKIQRVMAWNIEQFKEAKKIGILVSWKKGQLQSPFDIKKKLEKNNKEVYILAMDEISPEKVVGLKLDCLVNSACPRIGTDELQRYKIPIINSDTLELNKH